MKCKYGKTEIVNSIVHETCENKDLKELNKSNNKDIPCNHTMCSKFEEEIEKTTNEANKWKRKLLLH